MNSKVNELNSLATQKTGFNWLAFFFYAVYFAGKGKFWKGLLFAILGTFPPFALIIAIYSGKVANKQLNEPFSWGRAVPVLLVQIILGIIVGVLRSKR